MESVSTFGFGIYVEGIIFPCNNVIQFSPHARALFVIYKVPIIFETSMQYIRVFSGNLIFFNWTVHLRIDKFKKLEVSCEVSLTIQLWCQDVWFDQIRGLNIADCL